MPPPYLRNLGDKMAIRNELLLDGNELSGLNSGVSASLGLTDGVASVIKFGSCPAAGAVDTDVWALGATIPVYIFPDEAGESLTIESTELADTQEITIQGLDENGLEAEVVIGLTGTTPAVVAGLFRAVNRAYNSDSTETTGDVSIKGSVSGNTFAYIAQIDQQTTQCIYTVPADKYFMLRNISAAINSSTNQDASAIARVSAQTDGGVFRTQVRFGLQKRGTSNLVYDPITPPIAPPLTKLKTVMTPDDAGMSISAQITGILIDVEKLAELRS